MIPAKVRAKVAASRAAQGLPPVITDPATLERVAAVLRLAAPDEPLVPSQRKRRRTPTVDNQEVAPSPRQ